jgi:MYXO-CTERM domain-containing protein
MILGCAVTASSAASADGAAWDRHPRHATRAVMPDGVPADYVLTHNGFFHPSCVVSIRADEIWGRDAVIRGMDGVEHERIPPCAHPRYDLVGHPLPEGAPATAKQLRRRERGAETVPHSPDTYDGWITWYDTNVITVVPGSSLVTEWFVPAKPTTVGSQDIALFNDFETMDIILQSVLDFSEVPGEWAIESENCCGPDGYGIDVQSALVVVSEGDVIRGTIDMASCEANGNCSNWTITTLDVTTNLKTSLTMQDPKEPADEINPAVLETYGVTDCTMLPASGEAQFFDNTLTNATGGTEAESYVLETILSPPRAPSDFPTTCGYSGTTSRNDYTLIFGASPTPVGDAGEPPVDVDAGASSAPESSSGADGSTSSSNGPGGNTPRSPHVDAGGSSTDDEGVAIGEEPHPPASSSGCGCATAGGDRDSALLLAGLGGLVVVGGAARRRRTRSR